MELGQAVDGFFLDALRGFVFTVGGLEDELEFGDGLAGVGAGFFLRGFEGFLEGVGGQFSLGGGLLLLFFEVVYECVWVRVCK
jgi:hypothetical protein